MSTANQKNAPGGHYSGRNPVPNIQRFIESLDADKKNRDSQLEAEMKANRSNGEVIDHVESQPKGVKGTRKMVTDPTTGNQVQIENVNADFMKAVEQPLVCGKSPFLCGKVVIISSQLSVPNANVGKETVSLFEMDTGLSSAC